MGEETPKVFFSHKTFSLAPGDILNPVYTAWPMCCAVYSKALFLAFRKLSKMSDNEVPACIHRGYMISGHQMAKEDLCGTQKKLQ